MRKVVVGLALVAVVSFGAVVPASASPAFTKSATVEATGLGIAPPETCGVGVALADGSTYSFTGTYKTETSKSGNVTFQCKGKLAGDAPSRAIDASNPNFTFACFSEENNQVIYTNTWEVHITPSGNATYKCKVKG